MTSYEKRSLIQEVIEATTNPYQFLIDEGVEEYLIEQRAGEGWTIEEQLQHHLETLTKSQLLEHLP